MSVSLGAPRRGVVFGHLWEGFQDRTPERRNVVVVVVVVVAVFTINRSFYPTTSAPHPVSVLILYPREIKKNCDHRLRQKKNIVATQSRQANQNANVPGTRESTTNTPTKKIRT